MEKNAKRMVLVDEKLLDYKPMLQHYQTKQDMTWKRPTEQTVKSSIIKQMKSTIDDPAIPEDVKAKHYGQNLRRFLHTKRKLAEEPLVDLMPTIEELLDIKTTETPEKKNKKKIKKKKTEENERAVGLGRNPSDTRMSKGRSGRTWNRCITRQASPVLTAGLERWRDTAGRQSKLPANGWRHKTSIRCTDLLRRNFLGGRRSPKGLTISFRPILPT
jgi:hypothetical protein